MENDRFAEMAEESDDNQIEIEAGDDCPEDCDCEVHRLDHPRNPQIGTDPHPDAPEVEMVCPHHGVIAAR